MKLCIVVSPKGSANKVQAWRVDAAGQRELSIMVSAAPESGKATKAACEALASFLGIAKGRVQCVRGNASRHKQFEVDADEAFILEKLSSLEEC